MPTDILPPEQSIIEEEPSSQEEQEDSPNIRGQQPDDLLEDELIDEDVEEDDAQSIQSFLYEQQILS